MELFEVGGAVRDALLGQTPGDRDWVAVGATPELLLALGYKPVGRDFPVFLHPQTGEEVALARTERKSAPGYHGFVFHAAPEVTLEQDLARRDLTINAMARDAQGRIIDPFGGQADLRGRILRHVAPAFAEDPVRLLRVARFCARWPDFSVAPETLALLRQIVAAGEVDALVPERVWQEIARGLMETRPSRMWQLLDDSGALHRLAPELPASAIRLARLDAAAAAGLNLAQRYAVLLQDAEPALATTLQALGRRWRVPADCDDLAQLLHRLRPNVANPTTDADRLLKTLDEADAWRRPQRFELALQTAAVIDAAAVSVPLWTRALQAALGVDGAAVSAQAIAAGMRGPEIGAALLRARREAITQAELGGSPT
jgi:tRNA nucleotidyltransferase (CCA-adding enzyme)